MNSIRDHIKNNVQTKWQSPQNQQVTHLRKLLSSLQNHILAHHTLVIQDTYTALESNTLVKHLKYLIPFASNIYAKAADILESYPASLELLYNVLMDSLAGSMMLKIISSTLLMSGTYLKDLLTSLLDMLTPLDKLNRLLPVDIHDDYDYPTSGTETPTLSQLTDQSWVWVFDLERTCSLLIGQCLGSLLIGDPLYKEELCCRNWIKNELFSCGLDEHPVSLELIYQISFLVISNITHKIPDLINELSPTKQNYCKLALHLPRQYDEACALEENTQGNEENDFYDEMMETAGLESWDMDDKDGQLLDTVVRTFLIMCLKYTGLLQKAPNHVAVKEVYK